MTYTYFLSLLEGGVADAGGGRGLLGMEGGGRETDTSDMVGGLCPLWLVHHGNCSGLIERGLKMMA